jgi:hypothetical protein
MWQGRIRCRGEQCGANQARIQGWIAQGLDTFASRGDRRCRRQWSWASALEAIAGDVKAYLINSLSNFGKRLLASNVTGFVPVLIVTDSPFEEI